MSTENNSTSRVYNFDKLQRKKLNSDMAYLLEILEMIEAFYGYIIASDVELSNLFKSLYERVYSLTGYNDFHFDAIHGEEIYCIGWENIADVYKK